MVMGNEVVLAALRGALVLSTQYWLSHLRHVPDSNVSYFMGLTSNWRTISH